MGHPAGPLPSTHPTTHVYLITLLSIGHPAGPLAPHHSCLSHHTPINRPPSRSTSPPPTPPLVFMSTTPGYLIKVLSMGHPAGPLPSTHPTTHVYLITLLSIGHPAGPLAPHHSCLSHHTPINRPPSRSTSPPPTPPLVFQQVH
jgi:hypothetical protein